MKITLLSIALGSALLVGACASKAPPPNDPPYQAPDPPYQAPALSLHDRVHDALVRDMGNAASGITVRVDGSKVFLGGHVGSQADHNRAHDVAHDVSGVSSVDHKGLRVH